MTRAPVKLSREMKLLLMLLLMVGLIGLWYVWTNNRSASGQTQQPGQTATAGPDSSAPGGNPDAVPVAPGRTPDASPPAAGTGGTTPDGTTAGGTDGQPLTVQPDGQVDVEVIPPFPTDETATTPAPTPAEPAVPSGINPDGVIAAAPGRNPFRPLSLDAVAGAAPPATPAGPVDSGTSAGPVTAVVPSNPPSPSSGIDSLGSGGGPLGLSPIPGADGSVGVDSGPISGGAMPLPVIPGGDGSTGNAATPVVVPRPPANDTDTGQNTVTLSEPKPAPPPIAGVSVPSVNRLPSTQTGAPAGAGQTGSQPAPATSALPTPGTPQVITELGRGDASSGAAPADSELDRFVQAQELVFNAVVLGPVNTAIFRGRDGYVVVSSGQALPDSKVVVGAITPTSATLNLGTDTTILELDKR